MTLSRQINVVHGSTGSVRADDLLKEQDVIRASRIGRHLAQTFSSMPGGM